MQVEVIGGIQKGWNLISELSVAYTLEFRGGVYSESMYRSLGNCEKKLARAPMYGVRGCAVLGSCSVRLRALRVEQKHILYRFEVYQLLFLSGVKHVLGYRGGPRTPQRAGNILHCLSQGKAEAENIDVTPRENRKGEKKEKGEEKKSVARVEACSTPFNPTRVLYPSSPYTQHS
jgi:hypothetical protein